MALPSSRTQVFTNVSADAYGELLRSPFFFVRKTEDGAVSADMVAAALGVPPAA